MKFCKKYGDCGKCGENKYFATFHSISYKNSPRNSPHFLQKFTASILRQINVRSKLKALNAVKKNSPHFNAFLTKIHRKIHRISYKNSPHMISEVYSI